MSHRPVHFEIAVDDPARALTFYQEAFGWKFEQYGDQQYWLATTGAEGEPGINGALTIRDASLWRTVLTMAVDSVDDAVQKVIAAGGKLVMPKGPIPGQGWVAYCEDTEGTPIGVFQFDPKAGM